jgi:hypothetical protein
MQPSDQVALQLGTLIPDEHPAHIPPYFYPDEDHQAGLGDVVQSFFFSPSEVKNGFTWGAGRSSSFLPQRLERALASLVCHVSFRQLANVAAIW